MGFYKKKNTTSCVYLCQSKLFDQLYPSQQNYYCLIIRYYHFFFFLIFFLVYLRFYIAPNKGGEKKRKKLSCPKCQSKKCRVGKEFWVMMLVLLFCVLLFFFLVTLTEYIGVVQWDLSFCIIHFVHLTVTVDSGSPLFTERYMSPIQHHFINQ